MAGGRGGRRQFWVAAVAAVPGAVFALVAFSGCGGCGTAPEYPPNLTFPSRGDPVVLKLPEKPPTELNNPLRRNDEIGALGALGGAVADVATLPADGRAELDKFLKGMFGTPAAPTVAAGGESAARLKLTDAHLAEGSKLFRAKCVQCHNTTGDGRGPSGTTLPFARDYRQGQFKFVTSNASGKPRRDDILRTLKDGLRGTPMPSFALLPEGDRDLLAGYVTYLAVRGQSEFEGLKALAEGRPHEPAPRVSAILSEWEKADAEPPLPDEPADEELRSPKHQEAVRRGLALFTAKPATGVDNSCIGCHGEFGRKPALRYDVWGTVAKPANLTDHIAGAGPALKGGSRPQDVFARVRFGIAPVGMPAHPEMPERQVWDLVRFVLAAPYPDRLPDDVRDVVYPKQ